MAQEEEAKAPKADVFSAGVVTAELGTGKTPNPGPAQRRQGRMRVGVPEEERRADAMAAIRHPEIAEIAPRTPLRLAEGGHSARGVVRPGRYASGAG